MHFVYKCSTIQETNRFSNSIRLLATKHDNKEIINLTHIFNQTIENKLTVSINNTAKSGRTLYYLQWKFE